MESATSLDATRILQGWTAGDQEAPARLMPLIYEELRRRAADYLRAERPDHTLQATALVHEAYLKLIDQSRVNWQGRAHFCGVAAKLMRRILIDHARKVAYAKRGGGARKISLDEAQRWLSEALAIFAEAHDVSGYTLVLDSMALVAYRDGDLERAARLTGAVRKLERTTGTGLNWWNRSLLEVAPPATFDEPHLAAIVAEGESMTPEEAVAFALGG